jgi:hypothetical protein
MDLNSKIDEILKRLETKDEKPKPKDNWDRAQIVLSAITGLIAVALTIINLSVTKKLSDQANAQGKEFQQQQLALQSMEDAIKRRQETIQEITVLPTLLAMKTNPDPEMEDVANAILDQIRKDSSWLHLPLGILASAPVDAKPDTQQVKNSTSEQIPGSLFWVYLGEKLGDNWQKNNFNLKDLPKKGDIIQAVTPVFERESKPDNPEPQNAEKWYLGRQLGILKAHERVKVVQVDYLAGDNYWALVQNI